MLDVHEQCVSLPLWIQFLIAWTGLVLDREDGDGDRDRLGIWHRSAVLSVGTSRTLSGRSDEQRTST